MKTLTRQSTTLSIIHFHFLTFYFTFKNAQSMKETLRDVLGNTLVKAFLSLKSLSNMITLVLTNDGFCFWNNLTAISINGPLAHYHQSPKPNKQGNVSLKV